MAADADVIFKNLLAANSILNFTKKMAGRSNLKFLKTRKYNCNIIFQNSLVLVSYEMYIKFTCSPNVLRDPSSSSTSFRYEFVCAF